MKIFLTEEHSGRQLTESASEDNILRVGRDPKWCKIVFDQNEWPMVSRRHAEFRFQTDRCLIVDTNSSFGTFVDGERIREPVEACPGMRVQFGAGGPVLRILKIKLDSADTRSGIAPLETLDPYDPAERAGETVLASQGAAETSSSKAPGTYCLHCGNITYAGERFCRQCGALNSSREQLARARLYDDTMMPCSPPPPVAARQPMIGASEDSSSFERMPRVSSPKPQTGALLAEAPAAYHPSAERERPTNDTPIEAVRDVVRATVYAPAAAAQGESFLVQVFAHLQWQQTQADELARMFDAAAQQRGYGTLKEKVARGSKLAFHLTMPGLEIDDPVQDLMWYGAPESAQFSVRVPSGHQTRSVIGTVIVSCEGNPIGHVKFTLAISPAAEAATLANTGRQAVSDWKRYSKAFVSYASQDRKEVLKRVQMLSRLRIEYFQDVLKLEPGQRWEQQLYRHIDESDLFLLFWSNAAKRSQWVLKEVKYALERKEADDLDRPEIMPVIIEGPPPIEPPPELSHIHFNDYLLYFMNEPKRGTWWDKLKGWMGIS